jgi:hypothetical protein
MANAECPSEFTPELRQAVIDALRASYETAHSTYSPDEGLGDRVFGMAVFDVLTWRFQRDLVRFPHVRFESHGHGPELRVGDLRVRWNKVGREATTSGIARSFPRPSRAAGEMALENQTLPLWADGADLGCPLNWFVCHVGNPIDGLQAVYLACPITADGEQITGWHSAIAIWSAADPDTEFPVLSPPGPPEATPLPAFDIALIDEEQVEADAAG